MGIETKKLTYSNDQDTFEGVVAWDSLSHKPRPVVLVAHTYKGQSLFETEKAIALAKMGYLGFAIDMYGKGIRASTPDEAQSLMDHLNQHRTLLLERIQLALSTIMDHQLADKSRVAAIGFCFGGKCVLDLARSGEEIAGIVSFHGVYDQPEINKEQEIKAPVLILHGWEDPLATPQQTVDLAKELTARKADWTISAFGNTGHAFTNPNAADPANGMFYNQQTDVRSWKQMTSFLQEVFG